MVPSSTGTERLIVEEEVVEKITNWRSREIPPLSHDMAIDRHLNRISLHFSTN